MKANDAMGRLRPEWSPIKVWTGTWNAANLDLPFDALPLRAWL